MNILEFIEEQYPIADRVRVKLEDPYRRIEEEDNLPYDIIGPDETGTLTKLVEVEQNRYISVMDLISMSLDEVKHTQDEALILCYEAYMSQVDITDLNISDLMECVKTYKSIVDKREEQLGVLHL